MSSTETRCRLLDAAESLFARDGLDGTSLRAITTAAGTNLAAVNYHFGSKQQLILAVFQRRIEPLNCERLERLEQAQREAAPDPPAVEVILQAFLAPALRLRVSADPGAVHFMRLLGRMFSEPGDMRGRVLGQFRSTASRFVEALAIALPALPRQELTWRLHFLVGSLAHTSAAGDAIRVLTDGVCDPDDVECVLRRLTTYAAAGFRAPSCDSLPEREPADEHA